MEFRKAIQADLPSIIQLLTDDELGIERENLDTQVSQSYLRAFENIEKQEGNMIIVALDKEIVVGCLQLTFIPCLTHMGTPRAQIEGVRVASPLRGKGIGQSLIRHAIELARHNGCGIVQ
jgi:ribosomal protein S18 acetylase RimI-like enzyme